MKRFVSCLILIVLAASISWLFPLFHVVPLERAAKEKAAATFDPKAFAEKFWNDQLVTSLGKAVKAEVLLPAIQSNAVEAKKKFARSVGVSESYTYFISGEGRVLVVSDDDISLAVTGVTTNTEVLLQVGLLFSNAVRDGTGLLSVNDYPNSQDFNAISEALNRIIEERVLPKLRETAKVGVIINFVGCAEVNDESTDLKPLKVIPVKADIR